MVKSAEEKKLEKQYADAQAGRDDAIQQAQIQVYEGQITEARDAYTEARSKRSKARSKLPEEIPTDPFYKEKLLEAQYIKMKMTNVEDVERVNRYTANIKEQQKAKETIQVLDKAMPDLYTKAEQEVETAKQKISTAKTTETQKQDKMLEGYATQIGAIRKAEYVSQKEKQDSIIFEAQATIKRAEDKALKLDQEATQRQTNWVNFWDSYTGNKGKAMKPIHYMSVGGVGFGKGDLVASIGSRGKIGIGAHSSYYERASASLSARYGVTVTAQQARQISATGARTMSGKAKEQFTRSIIDPSGKMESDYQASRAQAKKNVASAYGAIAVQKANEQQTKLNELHEKTGGLLGQSFKQQSESYSLYGSKSLVGTNVKAPKGGSAQVHLSNQKQQQYFSELRAGNIGLAQALLQPETQNTYINSTMNTDKFLTERGYDTSKPETIPDSVFKPNYSEKYSEARQQAKTSGTMGDLTTLVPKAPAPLGYTNVKVGEATVGVTKNEYFKKVPEPELQKRIDANLRVAQFDPIIPTIDDLGKGKMITTTMNPVSFTDVKLEKKDQPLNYNPSGMPTGNQWVVTTTEKQSIPTMSGGVFQVDAPVENVFDTQMEAKIFAKKNQPKVFSGFDNSALEGWNYASAVETGEVIHPSKTETWVDDARFRLSQVFRPTYNIGAMAYNLSQPQDKQLPIKSTAEDVLIGGTIEDVKEGNILKGTGVTGLGKYIEEDYFRAGFELPSAVFTAMAGGKAISYGVKGVSYGVSATAKLGNKIIQSNAPTIVKVPTIAMMGTGQAIQRTGATVSAIPNRIGSSIYDYGNIPRGIKYGMPSFTIPQQVVRQGIVKPYDTATMFQGSRVGFGAKVNFILTPSGRMFVRQSTDIASEIGAKPQFLSKQVAMFENENVVGFATRGKMKTTTYEMPKETPFKSDVFTPTDKTKLIPKEGLPKEKKPFPELYDSKATISGKQFPELVKVEDIGKTSIPKLQTPTVLDRLKSTTLYRTRVSTKQYKTNIDEVTFYSDTTGDLVKGVKRPKAELQGEGVNYRGFEKPEITGTRTRLQDYKTSTSQSTIKGQLKYSEVAGGKIKFKGSPVRQVDTIVTGAKLTGKKNLKLIDDMVEEGQIEEVGKKTVMKGTDYFGGGKKAGQLKQSLESRNPTTYEAQSGKIKPKDETILYGVSKGKIPVDKKAFAQTMKESNLLREMADKAPLNKKPIVPKGVDEPPTEKYHAFIGESKSTGKTFQGTRVELGSGIGTTGVGSSFTKTNVDLGRGGGTSNIKDVKGMSSKPDVVGVTNNRINVKKFEEPKIQKGDKIVDGKEGSTVQRTKLDTFQETRIKLGQSAVVKPVQIQVPKVKASVKPPKVSPKIKQIVTPTVSQKTGTGLVQETTQLTKQKTKQKPKIKQTQRLRAVQIQSARTAVVAKTVQVQAVTQMKLPTIQKTTKRKGAGTLFYDTPNPQTQKRKRKRGKKAGFIGNVRLDNVVGMYKRKEITYGQKKVSKLERQDMRLTAGTKNRIALPSSGLLKTKNKKKSKTENVFGRKSKDEFSGFKSKPKKKSKVRLL